MRLQALVLRPSLLHTAGRRTVCGPQQGSTCDGTPQPLTLGQAQRPEPRAWPPTPERFTSLGLGQVPACPCSSPPGQLLLRIPGPRPPPLYPGHIRLRVGWHVVTSVGSSVIPHWPHPATRPSQLRPGDTFSGDHSSFQLNRTTLLFQVTLRTRRRLWSENAQPAPARKPAPGQVRLRSINNSWLAASDKVTLTPKHLSGADTCVGRCTLHSNAEKRRLITEMARPAPGGDGEQQCRPGSPAASAQRDRTCVAAEASRFRVRPVEGRGKARGGVSIGRNSSLQLTRTVI